MKIVMEKSREGRSIKTRSRKKVHRSCDDVVIQVKRTMHPGMTRREIKRQIVLLQKAIF